MPMKYTNIAFSIIADLGIGRKSLMMVKKRPKQTKLRRKRRRRIASQMSIRGQIAHSIVYER